MELIGFEIRTISNSLFYKMIPFNTKFFKRFSNYSKQAISLEITGSLNFNRDEFLFHSILMIKTYNMKHATRNWQPTIFSVTKPPNPYPNQQVAHLN